MYLNKSPHSIVKQKSYMIHMNNKHVYMQGIESVYRYVGFALDIPSHARRSWNFREAFLPCDVNVLPPQKLHNI